MTKSSYASYKSGKTMYKPFSQSMKTYTVAPVQPMYRVDSVKPGLEHICYTRNPVAYRRPGLENVISSPLDKLRSLYRQASGLEAKPDTLYHESHNRAPYANGISTINDKYDLRRCAKCSFKIESCRCK